VAEGANDLKVVVTIMLEIQLPLKVILEVKIIIATYFE
jgi:hypothetical protein